MKPKKKVRLFIQHKLLSESLTILLANHYELVEDKPDALVVDKPMLTPANIAAIQIEAPSIKVIVLGLGLDPTGHELSEMIMAGAHAYVRVTSGSANLINVIDLVLESDVVVWPSEALEGFRAGPFPEAIEVPAPTPCAREIIQEAKHMPNFSPREAQLFEYIRAGLSNKHIAREAQIAEATVKVHIKAILRKLRVQNRTQAAVWMTNNPNTITPRVTAP